MSKLRVMVAAAGVLALGLSAAVLSQALAGGDDIKASVLKAAAALKKGNDADSKKIAAGVASKADTEEVMHLFKPRTKEGLGVGTAKGVVSKDGIEMMILDLARDVATPARLTKEADAIAEMGYHIAALADVTNDLKLKWTAKKTQKDWQKWSAEMRDAGLKLSKAKGGQELKAAATKVRASCDGCHSIFR